MTLASLRGRVVFVRFWMDSCPFCRASLPAFEQLTKTFEGRRVTFIGMYHSKPFGSERPWAAAVKTARSWGATFPLAYDHMWRTLKTWYGDLLKRAPTSVSFVIDHEGRFSFVHPGPVFHPSKSPDHARCDQDYQAIKKAIWAALEKAERIDH